MDVDPRRLEPKPELRNALESFAQNAAEPDRTTAQKYLDYLNELDEIRESAHHLTRWRRGS
jgi:response regulator of citrate/malate metabolism